MTDRWVIVVAGLVAATPLYLMGYVWFGALVVCLALFGASKIGPQSWRVRAFTTEQRRQLVERDGMFCVYPHCGVRVHYGTDCPFGGCDRCYEADHVEAFSTGGATTLDNGVVSCRRCNRWKSARPVDEFLEDPDGDGVPGL